jgi:uncharacterized protein (TIGR02996 family)
MENSALLDEIYANPRDDNPRLIYADWLMDQGDPRGEFISLQCQRNRLESTDPAFRRMRKRELELLKQAKGAWVGPIQQMVDRFEFKRGFVSWVRMSLQKFIKHADELFRAAPLGELELRLGNRRTKDLAKCHQLINITSLRLNKCRMEDKGLEPLTECPYLQNLEELKLTRSGLTDNGARQLANCQHLAKLQTLDLYSNRIGAAGADAIANSEVLSELNTLSLASNWIGDAGLSSIANSKTLTKLQKLELYGVDYGIKGAVALLASRRLTSLSNLSLDRGWDQRSLRVPLARAIAESMQLKLNSLDIGRQEIGNEGLQLIVESKRVSSINSLNLWSNSIDNDGAKLLARSPFLEQLTHLNLSQNSVRLRGMMALGESKFLKRKSAIYLGASGIGSQDQKLLREQFGKSFGHFQ